MAFLPPPPRTSRPQPCGFHVRPPEATFDRIALRARYRNHPYDTTVARGSGSRSTRITVRALSRTPRSTSAGHSEGPLVGKRIPRYVHCHARAMGQAPRVASRQTQVIAGTYVDRRPRPATPAHATSVRRSRATGTQASMRAARNSSPSDCGGPGQCSRRSSPPPRRTNARNTSATTMTSSS
jgi:hypothetical protein